MAGTLLRSPPPVVTPPPCPAPVSVANEQGDAPAWIAGGHIPALDGLRALSTLLVLVAHAGMTAGTALPRGLGALGVDTFFVISGFLITLLLLRERRRNGKVSLRAFYVRRGFRILPAYAGYLIGLLVLSGVGAAALAGRDWLGALTYTVNFLPHPSWPVGHIWSLSVEEHFYLLWPVAFLLLTPRGAGLLAGGCVVAAPFARLLIARLGSDLLDVDYCTPARLDTIAAGCALALLACDPVGRRFLPRLSPSRSALAALLCVVGIILSRYVLCASGGYELMFHRTVTAACLAGLLWAVACCPHGPLTRFLDVPPLAWLGRLSYSLYLWQQPFLNPRSDAWICQWPVNLALAIALALASYYVIERPFLRLRETRGWGRA